MCALCVHVCVCIPCAFLLLVFILICFPYFICLFVFLKKKGGGGNKDRGLGGWQGEKDLGKDLPIIKIYCINFQLKRKYFLFKKS